MQIDFVAPPFSGHLYPALQLARGIQQGSDHSIRVLSTASAQKAVEDSGLEFLELLPGRDADVWAIAETPQRVGSNPIRLWKQVRSNLALMSDLRNQVRELWRNDRPDLTIVDFVVPVAGLAAVELGIHWWTGMPSPCALETTTGTPSYLGGWKPRQDLFGRVRDWSGRKIIRSFKLSTRVLFAKQFSELGIDSLYRTDQSEVIYSPEKILGYGLKELEFDRSWPACFEFIGPLPLPPPSQENQLPTFRQGRKTILVSIGTHLDWSREKFEKKIRQVAKLMPEIDFHFSAGNSSTHQSNQENNFTLYKFIPYTEILGKYDAVIHHAGTGVMYASLLEGLPSLVSPQDYDQFDHAARLVHHNLAKELPVQPQKIADALNSLINDGTILYSVCDFQNIAQSSDPVAKTLSLLSMLKSE